MSDFVSYCRLAPTSKLSNGKSKGKGNAKNGNAYLSWALTELATLVARFNRPVQRYLERKLAQRGLRVIAIRSLAAKLARCVYQLLRKKEPFDFRCINRLDRDTSGLTIIAKHIVSAGILSHRIADKNNAETGILREYLAIVKGPVTPPQGTINAPLGRKDGSIIERTIDFEHGEHAVTHYRVVHEKNGHSLLSLILETGRTHQIRVHLKYAGFPLIGDYLYNPDMEHMERQALHAYHLRFRHPITGEPLEFTAPIPEDMRWME